MPKLKDMIFCPHCGVVISQYEKMIQARITKINELSKKYPRYKQSNDSFKQGLYVALELLKRVNKGYTE